MTESVDVGSGGSTGAGVRPGLLTTATVVVAVAPTVMSIAHVLALAGGSPTVAAALFQSVNVTGVWLASLTVLVNAVVGTALAPALLALVAAGVLNRGLRPGAGPAATVGVLLAVAGLGAVAALAVDRLSGMPSAPWGARTAVLLGAVGTFLLVLVLRTARLPWRSLLGFGGLLVLGVYLGAMLLTVPVTPREVLEVRGREAPVRAWVVGVDDTAVTVIENVGSVWRIPNDDLLRRHTCVTADGEGPAGMLARWRFGPPAAEPPAACGPP